MFRKSLCSKNFSAGRREGGGSGQGGSAAVWRSGEKAVRRRFRRLCSPEPRRGSGAFPLPRSMVCDCRGVRALSDERRTAGLSMMLEERGRSWPCVHKRLMSTMVGACESAMSELAVRTEPVFLQARNLSAIFGARGVGKRTLLPLKNGHGWDRLNHII